MAKNGENDMNRKRYYRQKVAHKEEISDTPFDKRIWLSAKEAAVYLKRSYGQIRNMVWRRQIKAYKYTGRLYFDRRELDDFISRNATLMFTSKEVF